MVKPYLNRIGQSQPEPSSLGNLQAKTRDTWNREVNANSMKILKPSEPGNVSQPVEAKQKQQQRFSRFGTFERSSSNRSSSERINRTRLTLNRLSQRRLSSCVEQRGTTEKQRYRQTNKAHHLRLVSLRHVDETKALWTTKVMSNVTKIVLHEPCWCRFAGPS